jgi:dihydroneopterin aldolase
MVGRRNLAKSLDRIYISQVRCYGYTGLLPEEKVLGQWFEVDATLDIDLAPSGQSDRIEDTLDYRAAIEHIRQTVSQSKVDLIERVAQNIADGLLTLKGVERVVVRVTKPAAPIPEFAGTIAVEITRSRG